MGMTAELLAIGKYTFAIRDFLDYPADFYADVPIGATIITTVGICPTSVASELLAQAFGISVWGFAKHCDLSGEGADLCMLTEAFVGGSAAVVDFTVLRKAGFRFYFMPRG